METFCVVYAKAVTIINVFSVLTNINLILMKKIHQKPVSLMGKKKQKNKTSYPTTNLPSHLTLWK